MKKRIISLIVCAALLLSTCILAGAVVEPTEPQIVAGEVMALAGRTVDVSVSLVNNPGIWSMSFYIGYDHSVLTLLSVAGGEVFTDTEIMLAPLTQQTYKFTADNDDLSSNITDDGVLLTLTFAVSESAQKGRYPITLSADPDDIFDVNADNVEFELVNGRVTVAPFKAGDVNCDWKMNAKDIQMLRQHVAGWEVDYNPDAADVNCDGSINAKDIQRLRQYIAGWEVTIGPDPVAEVTTLDQLQAALDNDYVTTINITDELIVDDLDRITVPAGVSVSGTFDMALSDFGAARFTGKITFLEDKVYCLGVGTKIDSVSDSEGVLSLLEGTTITVQRNITENNGLFDLAVVDYNCVHFHNLSAGEGTLDVHFRALRVNGLTYWRMTLEDAR